MRIKALIVPVLDFTTFGPTPTKTRDSASIFFSKKRSSWWEYFFRRDATRISLRNSCYLYDGRPNFFHSFLHTHTHTSLIPLYYEYTWNIDSSATYTIHERLDTSYTRDTSSSSYHHYQSAKREVGSIRTRAIHLYIALPQI